MKYNLGDRVEVVRKKFSIIADLIGLTGKIIKIRTIPETEYEIKTGEIASYLIEADNYGPLMNMQHGKKKVYAWKPQDKTYRFPSELDLLQ